MISFKTETEGFETYRVCEIEENEALDTVAIGMLRNNQIKGLASLAYSRMNDKRALRYNVSSKISLKQFFMGKVDKKRFLTVVRNIVGAVDILTDYMMDKNQLITDKSEIYVNVGTLEVEMLYCPLLKENKELELSTLVKNLITETEFDQNDGEYVAELINFLNRPGGFAPAELKEYIDLMLGKPVSKKVNAAPMDNGAMDSRQMQTGASFNIQGAMGNSFAAGSQPSYGGVNASLNAPSFNNGMAAPQNMQGMQPAQNMQMNQPFAIPGMPSGAQPVQPAKDAGKKKKFSLFGSKKKKDTAVEAEATAPKKEKKAKSSKKKSKDVVTPDGIVIPGVQEKGSLPIPPKPAGAAIKQDTAAYASMLNPQAKQSAMQTAPGQYMQGGYQQMPQNAVQPQAQPTYVSQPVMQLAKPAYAAQNPVPSPQQKMYGGQSQVQQPVYGARNVDNSTTINTVLSRVPETTVLGGTTTAGETSVLAEGYNTMEKMRRPYLIRKRTNQKIDISKDVFRIGKEQSYVDYFVNDNSAISRSHADIVKRGDEYFIIDNNSLNHTYVNGEQIQSQVPTPLKDFDTVTLADEFFEYRL
ncbi:DUF6382 domain-containing protein [Butyrivibrio sp. JL13D10]|uniref:DUF6382 domain-containing protein n=1 Tax=Butyrivibrio sp. JL13D10 TaxID=3236815 RepID=UPI0038B610BA